MNEHTPTPWKINGACTIWSPSGKATVAAASEPRGLDIVRYKEISIGSPDFKEAAANAAFIVRACNAYDALVEALTKIQTILRSGYGTMNDECFTIATAALAQAQPTETK